MIYIQTIITRDTVFYTRRSKNFTFFMYLKTNKLKINVTRCSLLQASLKYLFAIGAEYVRTRILLVIGSKHKFKQVNIEVLETFHLNIVHN